MTEIKEGLSTIVEPAKQAAYWYVSVLNVSGSETYSRYGGQFVPLDEVMAMFRGLLLGREGIEVDAKLADSALSNFRKDFAHFAKLELDNNGQTLMAIQKLYGLHQTIRQEDKDKFAKVQELVNQMGY